jgi:hypothetical protein
MIEIENLAIIAAPSCAGKSTLIDCIQQGRFPKINSTIGLTMPSEWEQLSVIKLILGPEVKMDRLLLHYDMNSSFFIESNSYNNLSEISKISKKITVITLKVTPEILLERSYSRLNDIQNRLLTEPVSEHEKTELNAKFERVKVKINRYNNGYSTLLYNQWFLATKEMNTIDHWVLDTNKNGTRLYQYT